MVSSIKHQNIGFEDVNTKQENCKEEFIEKQVESENKQGLSKT